MVQGTTEVGFAELERRALTFEGELKLDDEGRARVALALHEENAADHCCRALAFHDAHPDRQLRMILTAAVELGAAAIPLLQDYLRRNPESADAHESLSEIRAQWGAGNRFADSYGDVLRDRPASKPLLMSYWNTLTRAGRLNEALNSMDDHRSLFEGDREFALLEVNIANHAGLTGRAGELIDRLDDRPDALLARGQHRMQTGNPRDAANLLEAVVRAEPGNLSAWALLEVAWRMLDDPRHEWLVGKAGLYAASELALSRSELEGIGSALRKLHWARAQPLGQSVRGGTQTAGQLFLRTEPDITLLQNALAAAIRQFVAGLPTVDLRHPLLRHRNMGMAFGPSWSVRLTGGGYHAAHFHPNGILSSACYIALPEAVADASEKPGWLEIGRPPPELGLDLPPLATFEPKPGRLVLFPSFLFHGTRPFPAGERLTVAFDLVPVPMN
jgi:hypothetical protein